MKLCAVELTRIDPHVQPLTVGRVPPHITNLTVEGSEMVWDKNLKSEYVERLKDPRWQKKRLEILNRDSFSCRECGDKESTLHVHHLFYSGGFGSYPWATPDWGLITLCESCHDGAGYIKSKGGTDGGIGLYLNYLLILGVTLHEKNVSTDQILEFASRLFDLTQLEFDQVFDLIKEPGFLPGGVDAIAVHQR